MTAAELTQIRRDVRESRARLEALAAVAEAHMALTETVAGNLKSQRTKRKLSQEALAFKAGLSVSYISMLERGIRSPPLDTLETLAGALGVRPTALLEG